MEDKLDFNLNEDNCPKCGSMNVSPVSYTWWGGVIGPKLLNHTKCKDCKYTYNRKTREPNTNKIIIYSVILFAAAFFISFYIFRR
jgi:transposase-like protein